MRWKSESLIFNCAASSAYAFAWLGIASGERMERRDGWDERRGKCLTLTLTLTRNRTLTRTLTRNRTLNHTLTLIPSFNHLRFCLAPRTLPSLQLVAQPVMSRE